MGKITRRKPIIIVPDGYWLSSYNNIEWIYKESDAKRNTRNKTL
jgi:hypothetical protein